ncbi:MAG: hypothetical protein NC115_04125 [Bacteroidales bacterium]|nr:hypothetical protein [Bacteroidales bacterium]
MASKVYRIESVDTAEGKVTAKVALNPDSDIFKGHFPGQPILPGVCSVQMLGEIMSGVLGVQVFINEVSSCKYLKTVNPVEDPVLNLEISYTRDGNKAVFTAAGSTENGEPYLKIKASAIC